MEGKAIAIRATEHVTEIDISGEGCEHATRISEILHGDGDLLYLHVDDGIHCYVNEEGRKRGYWQNRVATRWMHSRGWGLEPYDYICGTMVILGHSGGLEVGLTDEEVSAILGELKELEIDARRG